MESEEQHADFLTKPRANKVFCYHRDMRWIFDREICILISEQNMSDAFQGGRILYIYYDITCWVC